MLNVQRMLKNMDDTLFYKTLKIAELTSEEYVILREFVLRGKPREDVCKSVKQDEEPEVVEDKPCTQRLDVMLDKRNRNGKKVTLVVNFDGSDDALKTLAKELKQHCGVGGSARGGEILIQGDYREKILEYLKSKGYKARII